MEQQKLPLESVHLIYDEYAVNADIVLHLGDSLKFLKTIPSGTANLIITSPPYNLGKTYECKIPFEEYLKCQSKVIDELVRILKDDGSICWQVGNYIENKEVYPLDMYFYPIFKSKGLKLKNRIIWHMGFGMNETRRFSGRYETILWFTKSDDYKFMLDRVRVPSKYPGKRHHKGEKKGLPSGNPLGKNPSDLWHFVVEEWERKIWEIPNVKSAHPEKTIHPCQFPVELVERCLLAFTDENDVVLDPYSGVGSSLIAGLKHNRKVIGVDKEPDYIDITKERIEAFYNGTLKIRELGKPVMVPSGNEKVSQIPEEWKLLKETASEVIK